MSHDVETEDALRRAAVDQRGKMDGYMQFMVELTKGVQVDEKTKTIIFGLLIGTMNSEVARKATRPYLYIIVALIAAVFALTVYVNNLMLQVMLGVL